MPISNYILLSILKGLGKTVQSVVALLLRNEWYEAHGKCQLPSLIASPNEQVLLQWHDTLKNAGVNDQRIHRFIPKKGNKLGCFDFVLLMHSNVQTEVKWLFEIAAEREEDSFDSVSPLVSVASWKLLNRLMILYK